MPKTNRVGNENLAGGQERMPAAPRRSVSSRIAGWYLTPALAPIMQNRRPLLILAGLAAFQILLAAAGGRGWPCPIQSAFGLACPGCGLTRSAALLIQGKWQAAASTHAFAPLFLGAFILSAVCGVMPRGFRQYACLQVAALEKRTGIGVLVVLAMLFYWGFRLAGWIEPLR